MTYGIIFWVTLFTLSMFEGMRTWTWFDEACLRIYAKAISTAWYWEERLNSER